MQNVILILLGSGLLLGVVLFAAAARKTIRRVLDVNKKEKQ